eukprot:GHRQ01006093.1.p2 GENE.GHRQ01006093.1~~GHRQ01006093.1.p2  ORF type:complete len:135 (-),score=3.52 GHRQ01006093.1:189-593(-)
MSTLAAAQRMSLLMPHIAVAHTCLAPDTVLQPLRGKGLLHVWDDLCRACRSKLVVIVLQLVDGLRPCRGVQLERQPVHIKLCLAFKLLHRFFQPAFSHVAPRANHIANHVNFDCGLCSGHGSQGTRSQACNWLQ